MKMFYPVIKMILPPLASFTFQCHQVFKIQRAQNIIRYIALILFTKIKQKDEQEKEQDLDSVSSIK